MIRSITAAALAFVIAGLSGPALGASAETLQIYGGMAKLEANKAEAAGAVMKAAAFHDDPAVLEEAAEDFASDRDQLAGYIEALGALNLSDSQRAALDAFAEGWNTAAEEGAALIEAASMESDYRARLATWWESLDDLDDTLDDALEEILEAEGVAFEDDD